jgi:hypothetical protein
MKKADILKEINMTLTSKHLFVKWWRKESDFVDYDLLDRFLSELSSEDDIGGIALLTMGEMWEELKRVCGDKVRLVQGEHGKIIGWLHESKDGLKSCTCDYSPENLLKIFDTESRGNPIS